jgi:hypothetical protein
VRFRFNGFNRETGKPVAGYVDASDTEAAYQVLSDREIVTETLREEPKPASAFADTPAVSKFSDALEDALGVSSSPVPLDDLNKRLRGKKVWVVDREKIRQRVTQVVDSTLAQAQDGDSARDRVSDAIDELFADTHNIASQHDMETVAKMRAAVAAAKKSPATSNELAEQIGRLTGVVEQAEGLISAMQTALRNVETGGGSAPRRQVAMSAPSFSLEQNSVLREIFETNLQLRRAMESAADSSSANATGTN